MSWLYGQTSPIIGRLLGCASAELDGLGEAAERVAWGGEDGAARDRRPRADCAQTELDCLLHLFTD